MTRVAWRPRACACRLHDSVVTQTLRQTERNTLQSSAIRITGSGLLMIRDRPDRNVQIDVWVDFYYRGGRRMSMTPNTSRDQGSPEEPAATAGPEPRPGQEIPVITVAEVMLSTAAAQSLGERRTWWVDWKGRIAELTTLAKRPRPRPVPRRRSQFLEDACMAREMRRL
jgi:hypothetical protein